MYNSSNGLYDLIISTYIKQNPERVVNTNYEQLIL